MLQDAVLFSLLKGPRPVRITLGGRAYGSDAPFDEKILAFVPARVVAPALPVIIPDGTLPVLGAVRMPKGVVRGIICDGKVVSWAVARRPDENGVSHVTVETDVRYRKRGYARACLQALVQASPAPLIYLCDSRNAASAAAARAAGFVQIGSIEQNGRDTHAAF